MISLKLFFSRHRRGAAAVELAFVSPIFLILVFGIVEFGRGMTLGNLLTNVALEGARMAAVDGSTNVDVTSSIKALTNSALGVAASNVTVEINTTVAEGNPDPTNSVASCKTGDVITVTVQVPYNCVALIPNKYLSGKQLVGQGRMRHE